MKPGSPCNFYMIYLGLESIVVWIDDLAKGEGCERL